MPDQLFLTTRLITDMAMNEERNGLKVEYQTLAGGGVSTLPFQRPVAVYVSQ